MPNPRPLECPACGHDRVQAAPPTAASRPRAPGGRWVCGLCRYQWVVPGGVAPRPQWEIA